MPAEKYRDSLVPVGTWTIIEKQLQVETQIRRPRVQAFKGRTLFLEPFARGWGTGVRLTVKGCDWENFPTSITVTALFASRLSESIRVRNQLRCSWNIKCFTYNTLVSYQATSWICYATLIKGVRALAYWLPSPQMATPRWVFLSFCNSSADRLGACGLWRCVLCGKMGLK